MPINTLVRLGHYQNSFHRLHAEQDRYWNVKDIGADHEGHAVDEPPEKFKDGIRFGLMQTAVGHVVVRINKLVLPAPVLFVGVRHGPKGPAPSWPEIDEEATLNILVDAIVANPGLRDDLMALACRRSS